MPQVKINDVSTDIRKTLREGNFIQIYFAKRYFLRIAKEFKKLPNPVSIDDVNKHFTTNSPGPALMIMLLIDHDQDENGAHAIIRDEMPDYMYTRTENYDDVVKVVAKQVYGFSLFS